MDLSFIKSVLNVIPKFELIAENKIPHLILIRLNWEKLYFEIETFESGGSGLNQIHELDGSKYTKENFISEMRIFLVRFSFIYIESDIAFYDNDKLMFHSERCRTLRDKVISFTGLDRHRIFEVNSKRYKAKIYFFVLPLKPFNDKNDGENLIQNMLITSGYFNTAATNSLYSKMIHVSSKLSNVLFIGKIKDDKHDRLKDCLQVVVERVHNHFHHPHRTEPDCIVNDNDEENDDYSIFNDNDFRVEDDEDAFCEFNTSDIANPSINSYSKGLCEIMTKDRKINVDYQNQLKHFKEEDVNGKAVESTQSQVKGRESQLIRNLREMPRARLSFRSPSSSHASPLTHVPVLNPERKNFLNFEISYSKKIKTIKSKLFSDTELQKCGINSLSNTTTQSENLRKRIHSNADASTYLQTSYNNSQRFSEIPPYKKSSKHYSPATGSKILTKTFNNGLISQVTETGRLQTRNIPSSVNLMLKNKEKDVNNNNDTNTSTSERKIFKINRSHTQITDTNFAPSKRSRR